MPREIRLPPSAASLSASMRDVGYSLETAIADLVDNSISADAQEINIYCIPDTDEPTLAVIDNGYGMSADEIVQAMRHGGNVRKQQRSPNSLGKFGLGLKTASFSQCRRLTVVSRKDRQLNAVEWNLDVVARRDDWIISRLDKKEINSLPFFDDLPEQGTMVLWRNLDRLIEDSEGHIRQQIANKKLAAVTQHLSLVFHRFMKGDVPWCSQLNISVNGHLLTPFDPFCRDHTATQLLPLERIPIESHEVQLQGYILPHHSKLSSQKYNLYKDHSGFFENQGVYVYRNCRLVAWGGWFRLTSKSRAAQLARVQIDFPSSLDHLWTIDIKKSSVRPPRTIRRRLSQILDKFTERSKRVYTDRGQRLISAENPFPLWERFSDSTRGVRYALNINHPLVEKLNQQLDQIGRSQLCLLLNTIGEDLPVERISIDWNDDPKKTNALSRERDSAVERIRILCDSLPEEIRHDSELFQKFLRSTRLFDQHWDAVEKYVKGMQLK